MVAESPLDVEDSLAQLGITLPPLLSALEAGRLFVATRTENSTNAGAGIGKWDAITEKLREELNSLRWRKREPGNFALTVHPSGEWAIAVVAGNEATGLSTGSTPSNGSALGDGRIKAINENEAIYVQSELPGMKAVRLTTFFLLHHTDHSGTIRAELSLPVRAQGGYVTKWHSRIILPTSSPTIDAYQGHVPSVTDPTEPTDELVIPVDEIEEVS